MARLIPVSEWAQAVFGSNRPHANTLLRWIQNGKILPRPKKIGREYFCTPGAEYVDPIADRINRMTDGRSPPQR